MRIHLVPNSHIDPVWLWDKYEGIDEGRWEAVGGWWVESDTNLTTESGMRNQSKISKAFALKHFGTYSNVAYIPDTFGH